MQLSNQQFKETILPDIITTTPNKNNKIIFSSHLLPLRNLNDNSNHFLQNIKRETYILPGKVLEEEKENVFNDSLEMNTPFEKMIRENVFTPHSSPNVFQPTFCSSEEKSRSKLLLSPQLDSSPMNFSVRTYIINRANNISTKNLTYTKDLNNTSLKTIDFAQRSSFLCSSMKDEYKKRKYSPTLETITKTPKRLRSFQQSTTWDPFLLAATTNVDPFLMLDGEWIEEEVSRFTKWLNALLTPPSDLQSDAVHPVNVARMWRECSKGKEVAVAPTKELISNTYHVSGRLVVLREAAMNLFRKSDIVLVLKKVANAVDSGKLSVRNDRDLHLDLSLQSTIMSFLLSYNPLWLRIGLETIYSTVITLKHNSDMMGLSQFLMTRFFRDPYLLSKHKTSLSNNYAVDIKKFMLKKYLGLVYFLDQAKSNKLIKHDPCLFCKNAPIKESKEMLFQFSKEVLHAVGDITKYLKYFGYAVCHKQTFLDEFDYAVTNLGVDLRDGIRLTKTVEIVLLKNDLMQNLRAPAVSRLQKIHNVQVAFTALKDNGFEIVSDIDPRDIVNGHKEKTLSFLWQILFKFQGPLLKKSVTTIQKWWRSFPIVIKRRIFEKEREKQRKAVLRIEIWYKRLKLADALERIAVVVRQVIQELKLEKAVIKIQSYFRMYSQRIKYKKIKTAVLKRRNEAALLIQHFLRYVIIRRNYLRLKSAVIKTEEMYTAKKLMKEERFKFLRIKAAAIHIQVWYRSVMITRQIRNNYQKTLWAVKVLQTWHRANKQAKLQRLQYLELKATVQFIESRRKIKLAREQFLELKKATLLVQRSYRAKKVRQSYVRLKNSVVTIQSVFRATKLMQKQQNYYKDLKKSTIFIQRTYLAKRQRNEYLKMQKSAIKIQSYYKMYLQKIKYEKIKKSVLLIQKYIRKFLLRRKQKAAMVITVFLRGIAVRNKYLKLKNATVAIQTKYRAKKLMQQQLLYYQALRRSCICIQKHCRKYLQRYHAAVTIQRWYRSRKYHQKLLWAVNVIQARYRAKKQGRSQRLQYLKIKATVQLIENRLIAKIARNQFLRTRNAVILIQQFYRTRKIHINYLQLKKSTITIQTIFRANKMMQKQLQYYQDLKKSVVFAQRTFRAKKQRTKYLKMRENAIKIQSYYRMHCQKVRYEKTKKLVVLIQRNCRKFLLRRRQKAAIRIVEFLRGIVARNQYLKLKKAVGSIEERYRAKKLMQQQLLHYQTIKNATISIQRYYRKYLRRKHAAITIQRWYRTKKSHQKLLWAVSVIQRRFRARKEMILQRAYYLQLLIAVKFTQQTFRAKLTRKMYLQMKNSAVLIQCYYKMKKERLKYLKLRRAALVLQQHFRAIKAMKKERTNYLQLMAATILVQKRFRTNQLAKKERNKYIVLKCAVISMQRLYKTKKQRTMYLQLRYAVVLVQRRYRTLKHMRIEKTRYLALKQNTIVIQRYYRALQEMRRQHHDYLQLKRNTVMIQRRFRALKLMKIDRERFLVLKKTVLYVEQTYIARCLCTKYNKMKRAAIVIQKYYRSFYVMKKERVIFLCKLKTIYNIQRFARGFLARKKWGDLRNIDEFRQKRKEEQATVKIQVRNFIFIYLFLFNVYL